MVAQVAVDARAPLVVDDEVGLDGVLARFEAPERRRRDAAQRRAFRRLAVEPRAEEEAVVGRQLRRLHLDEERQRHGVAERPARPVRRAHEVDLRRDEADARQLDDAGRRVRRQLEGGGEPAGGEGCPPQRPSHRVPRQ